MTRPWGNAAIAVCLFALVGCDDDLTALSVLEVRPKTGTPGQTTSVEIVGEGFLVVPRANYDDPHKADVDATFVASLGGRLLADVTFHGRTMLKAVVPSGLAPGIYDLEVRGPDGRTGRLAGAFTVVGPRDGGSDATDGGVHDGASELGQDGPVSDGPVSDGPVSDGPRDGPASDGALDARPPDLVADDAAPDKPVVPVDLVSPDTLAPDVLIADQAVPDVLSPDVLSPDVLSPDVLSPDVLSPDVLSPDIMSPDVLSPDVLSPDTMSPDTMAFDAMTPDKGVCGSSCATCTGGCCSQTGQSLVCPSGCSCYLTSFNGFLKAACLALSKCSVDCRNTSECYPECSGVGCIVDCTGNSNRCEVACQAGSCELDCSKVTGVCGFTTCHTKPLTCANNIRVCGRLCP